MKKTFKPSFKEKNILDVLKCNRDKDNYVLYSSTLNDVITTDLECIIPSVYYVKDVETPSSTGIFGTYYCIATLGFEIDKRINFYFETGQYLEGLLLSALGDEILYNLNDSLFVFLQNELEPNTFLSKKFEIGDFPPDFLTTIFHKINKEEPLENLNLTSGYMISNSKSMAYFYNITDKICSNKEHNCSTCLLEDCKQRKIEIKIKNTDTILSCYKFDNLLDVLRNNNIQINANCNGKGICKNCKVTIIENQNNIYVLACDYYVVENITIEFSSSYANLSVVSMYKKFDYTLDKFSIVELDTLSLTDNKSFESTLDKNLNLNVIKKLNDIEEYNKPISLLIENNTVIDINPKNPYAIAIDIGTTTVVVALVDILTGDIVKLDKFSNPQLIYGADVVSRIEYSTFNREKLTKSIIDALNASIDFLLQGNYENLKNIVITGNTTMIYLVCGINPKSLATAPFSFSFNKTIKFNSMDIFNKNYGDVIILPSISAYVGSDITSGILGCNLINSYENIILVDIGTNGEIVLKSDKLYCCATAAGPVFEGSNIECGTTSVDGAICKVDMINNNFTFETINNIEPIGICGSGVIDIMATLLKNNLVDENGLMEDFEQINITEEIYFSQKDIRQLQLAKSSILSGIDALLSKANLSYAKIDKLYLGGGFGSNISLENTVKIGLLPEELLSKIIVVGNCGLFGAIKYATSNSEKDVEKILNNTTLVELATDITFTEKFIENLNFKVN